MLKRDSGTPGWLVGEAIKMENEITAQDGGTAGYTLAVLSGE